MGQELKSAFTLAEVLITLSIIGVVAALTIPSLITKNQEKELITQLKKSYNTFSNAYTLATIESGSPDMWGFTSGQLEDGSFSSDNYEKAASYFTKHLNVVKTCKDTLKCMPKNIKNIDGAFTSPADKNYSFILADGSIVTSFWTSNTSGCVTYWGAGRLSQGCGGIQVDVNGQKAPNTYGKDIFNFLITKSGIIPEGTKEDMSSYSFNNCKTSGLGCAAWVLTNENMDYLRKDVNWD